MDIPALLEVIDLVVLPSRSEGLSLTLIEACAAATPILATNVGGNPEVVRDGENGRLVKPNDIDALARMLKAMLSDKPGLVAMGEEGRRQYERTFTMERMKTSYLGLYSAS